MKKLLAFMTAMCLFIAFAGFAQGTKGKQATVKAATKQATGTVKSVDTSSLVLTHKVQGKDADTTFVLNADTKKEGDPAVGAKATVHYKVEGTQNIATSVVAAPPAKKK
jgi:hypothetical protein